MKLAAPMGNGEILAVPDFAAIPKLVEDNRKRLDAAFPELRRQARRDRNLTDGPIIITGHQPEFFHPGVWIKQFAAAGLARKVNGKAFNLVVDTDTIKSTAVRLPQFDAEPANVQLTTLAYDDFDSDSSSETRHINNEQFFASFGDRLRAATNNWPFVPCGIEAWKILKSDVITTLFLLAHHVECITSAVAHTWELPNKTSLLVSLISRSQLFQNFAKQLIARADELGETYNTAIRAYRQRHKLRSRNHPAPELEPGELPFWTIDGPNRRRTWKTDAINYDQLRPKALVLTMFARLILGDFFIHGLGGGRYDEVTDDIIRSFFKIDPPAFQILTGTLHLPFPESATNEVSFRNMEWYDRYGYWNPHRLFVDGDADQSETRRHSKIVAFPTSTAEKRRSRYHEFRKLSEELRPRVADRLALHRSWLDIMRKERQAGAVLLRRDYAWILYPESVLKPFLQRFLNL